MTSRNYDSSPGRYYSQILQQAVPAIALGIVLDRTLKKMQNEYKIRPIIMIIMQIIIGIAILYLIEKYISKAYATAWQNTTPGFYFVTFYFSTQFQLFTNLGAL